jgi:hypothetical protein
MCGVCAMNNMWLGHTQYEELKLTPTMADDIADGIWLGLLREWGPDAPIPTMRSLMGDYNIEVLKQVSVTTLTVLQHGSLIRRKLVQSERRHLQYDNWSVIPMVSCLRYDDGAFRSQSNFTLILCRQRKSDKSRWT